MAGEKSAARRRPGRRWRRYGVLALALGLGAAASGLRAGSEPPDPSTLKRPTIEAYNRYIQLTDERHAEELRGGKVFLWIDRLPAAQRQADYAQLRGGQMLIEKLETLDGGNPIHCPSGIIHHWAGAVFIPGATLEQTLALVKDYDRQSVIYAPDVQRSKTLAHNGGDYTVYLRFKRKKVITVVLNAEFDIHYTQMDERRATSRAKSTRIAEVADHDTPQEHELPVGGDGGYLWRMDNDWRFLEQDGGTYLECETVSLTRDIPFGLRWLIAPFVSSIPRESLAGMMSATRKALAPPASTSR